MWFQNYKSHHFSSSLHSSWSLYRTERLIGAKCFIWACSKALWCMLLFPLFPLLAFIKYLSKAETWVLKSTLVPNAWNPSLLSGQRHFLIFLHDQMRHIQLKTSIKTELKAKKKKNQCACFSWKAAYGSFLRVKVENRAEQQMFMLTLVYFSVLWWCWCHAILICLLGDQIQTRRSNYGSLNSHQSYTDFAA